MGGGVVLETPRLALRELRPDDLDAVASMLGDPEVMRFWPRPYTREEARGWILAQRERYAGDGSGYWLAVQRSPGHPVGQASLLTLDIDGTEEISLGYIIHRPFWRRGLAVEAARGCLEYAFQNLGEDHVLALIRPENAPSRGVARKLGMVVLEGRTTYRAGFLHLIYAASRDAWP